MQRKIDKLAALRVDVQPVENASGGTAYVVSSAAHDQRRVAAQDSAEVRMLVNAMLDDYFAANDRAAESVTGAELEAGG